MSDLPTVADPGSEHLASAYSKGLQPCFIETTPAQVEALKKQSKRIQRNGGGKHADLLNRVARKVDR